MNPGEENPLSAELDRILGPGSDEPGSEPELGDVLFEALSEYLDTEMHAAAEQFASHVAEIRSEITTAIDGVRRETQDRLDEISRLHEEVRTQLPDVHRRLARVDTALNEVGRRVDGERAEEVVALGDAVETLRAEILGMRERAAESAAEVGRVRDAVDALAVDAVKMRTELDDVRSALMRVVTHFRQSR